MTAPRPGLLLTALALAAIAAIAACAPGGPSAPASPAPTGSPAGRALPLLIDTDVAADDLVAIAFLLGSPSVEIRAIAVSGTGEAHCGAGVDVVLRLLERLDAPPIDVACGRETPIAGDRAFPDAWRERVDGGSGLDLPATSRQPFAGDAVELIVEASEGADGLRVLTLGPMTNLAGALTRHPDLADRLESVHAMGGALFVPGNVRFGGPPDNAVAEWNIYVDPAAAQAVIDSGLPVRLVSLDGTSQAPVTQEYAQRVADEATGPGALVLAELFAANPFMTDGTYFLWDPLAAALAAGHPLGSFSAARVEVEQAEGPEVGFTRPVEGPPNVEYLSAADLALVEGTLLETLNQETAPASVGAPEGGGVVIVGRILTMDDPPVAGAMLIEDGTVTAVGARDEVLALAGDGVPVIDIGQHVAYPGFIDAHAHWIGDRDYYGVDTAAEAIAAAATRGWTSISEQWVNPERLDELTGLAEQDALPLRVDAYLALNFGTDFLGDWYASREPGPVNDRLRVQGLKIHLDNGWGTNVLWEPADLTATIGRANGAGWQVSVHAIGSAAQDLVLDAFEAALGPAGPNPLHHRIEHAIQVTDDQLARMAALGVATVIHLDGAADWVQDDDFLALYEPDDPGDAESGHGSPAGVTSWTPGCTLPRRPTRRGPSRISS